MRTINSVFDDDSCLRSPTVSDSHFTCDDNEAGEGERANGVGGEGAGWGGRGEAGLGRGGGGVDPQNQEKSLMSSAVMDAKKEGRRFQNCFKHERSDLSFCREYIYSRN